MSIEVTTADVGKRVTNRDGDHGIIKKVIGTDSSAVYVKWDYQPHQDAPYPTVGRLLDWEVDEESTEDTDDGSTDILGAVIGDMLSDDEDDEDEDSDPVLHEDDGLGPIDPEPDVPDADSDNGFGGGGSEGDF